MNISILWHQKIFQVSRPLKRLIMISADTMAIILALWSSFALSTSDIWPIEHLQNALILFFVSPIFGILIFIRLGFYRAVVRFVNVRLLFSVALGVLLLVMILQCVIYLMPYDGLPNSVSLIFGLTCWLYVGGSRFLFRSYYHWWMSVLTDKKRALIYGAGSAGAQLALALQKSADVRAACFVDDNGALQGDIVGGLPVHNAVDIGTILQQQKISIILLAITNISEQNRRAILKKLAAFPVIVKTMPSMAELIDGKSIDELRDVEVTEILGRDTVTPIDSLISGSIKNKSVCITGAGGSIGSELSRQALANGASVIVLFEISEVALYTIEQELSNKASLNQLSVKIIPVLGSVRDEGRLFDVLKHFKVNTLFHAAAYKHVPLVEQNVLQGLENNTLGTLSAARAAQKAKLERFILISTDKAVRPTNIMGATKRFAELCVQHYSKKASNTGTIFTMVRFGNVLASSGSVVPLFKEQIAKGGPVTVTHPEITRFFMTISEAASLVIQAGTMARGGEVFVLDMGEPVKISQLAESMIHLSGLQVKTDKNPDGDIEILYCGLRPGEKLYEEILIGGNMISTEHSKIVSAQEEMLDDKTLLELIASAEKAVADKDSKKARNVLMQAVPDFKPSSENIDLLQNVSKI